MFSNVRADGKIIELRGMLKVKLNYLLKFINFTLQITVFDFEQVFLI